MKKSIKNKRVLKDELAHKIAREDGISKGLVCVLAITEGCLSFRLKAHRNGPRLWNRSRLCKRTSLAGQTDDLASHCNPLLAGLLNRIQYYWVCDQAEYATDVLFNNPEHLNLLYEKILEHAIVPLGAKDILSFPDKVAVSALG